MQLLLDTQIALWLLADDRKLRPSTRTVIDSATTVHVSAGSVFEITVKAMLGKLTAPEGLDTLLRDAGLSPLAVSARHAERIRDFPMLSRHDPFDRLLLAQATCDGLSLLTADRALIALGLDFVVDAR
jgi:PIN domain nuclease of toxin-antitoxin system